MGLGSETNDWGKRLPNEAPSGPLPSTAPISIHIHSSFPGTFVPRCLEPMRICPSFFVERLSNSTRQVPTKQKG